MTVDCMRRVDRWLGIPLCVCVTLLARLWRLAGPSQRTVAPERILCVQLSEMGSAISAYNALRILQQRFPQAQVYYFVFAEMRAGIELLDMIPAARIITVSCASPVRFMCGWLRAVWQVRRAGIDTVLDFELFSRVSVIAAWLFGARTRVGFDGFHMEGLYRGGVLTHRVIYNHTRHISENFLALVHALEYPAGPEPLSKTAIDPDEIVLPRVAPDPAGGARMRRQLRQLCPAMPAEPLIVILNPNGSNLLPLRRWPMEHYVCLARRLLHNPRVVVVVTGSAAECADVAAVCTAVAHDRCIDLAGKTTLPQLMDLYGIARLMVSNDSGPPNFASLTGLTVLVLFGPETPLCYKPLGDNVEALYAGLLCSPCVSAYNHRKSACTDNRCLRQITVEQVCARIRARAPEIVA